MKLYPEELETTEGTSVQLTTGETEPASSTDSWKSIYDIISSLEKYKTEEVLFYAAEILGKEMGSKNVAIYNVANREYARLYSSTSLEARRLGNSIK